MPIAGGRGWDVVEALELARTGATAGDVKVPLPLVKNTGEGEREDEGIESGYEAVD